MSLPANLRIGAALLAALGALAWWVREPPPGQPAAVAPSARPVVTRTAEAPRRPLAPRAPVVLEPPVFAFDPVGTYPTQPLPAKVGTVEGAADDEATGTMGAPAARPLPPPSLEDKPVITYMAPDPPDAPPLPARAYNGEGARDDAASDARPE
jgi:hypothetical protein